MRRVRSRQMEGVAVQHAMFVYPRDGIASMQTGIADQPQGSGSNWVIPQPAPSEGGMYRGAALGKCD